MRHIDVMRKWGASAPLSYIHGMMKVTIRKTETFKAYGKRYVPVNALSVVFNKRGLVKQFDKTNILVHPTKGNLYPLTEGISEYIKLTD